MNFWLAIKFTPASFLVFFKTGPLAWNGLLVWWFPLLAFLDLVRTQFRLPASCSRRRRPGADGTDALLERQIGELRARLDALSAVR